MAHPGIQTEVVGKDEERGEDRQQSQLEANVDVSDGVINDDDDENNSNKDKEGGEDSRRPQLKSTRDMAINDVGDNSNSNNSSNSNCNSNNKNNSSNKNSSNNTDDDDTDDNNRSNNKNKNKNKNNNKDFSTTTNNHNHSNSNNNSTNDDNCICSSSNNKNNYNDDDSNNKNDDSNINCNNNASKQEQQKQSEFFKTSLCSYFRKANQCRHGELCKYAHGEAELRPKPDGSWDPTSERGKKKSELKRKLDLKDDECHGPLRKCIIDLPVNWSSDDFKNFLKDQGVDCRMSKKRRRLSVGFVEFESDEQMVQAKQKLEGFLLHSRELKVADALPRAWETKDELMDAEETPHTSNKKVDAKPTDICDIVTPLATLPYEQQLEKKRAEISQVLKKLVRNVRKVIPSTSGLPSWITDARLQGGLCCTFNGVVASPIIDGYRNKCEFTIGLSIDGRRVVGFLSGNFREGYVSVSEPHECRNVSSIARAYAKGFQEFVQKSELSVWDKAVNAGFWRLFTVREGRCKSTSAPACGIGCITEVMLIVQVCTRGVEENVKVKEFHRMAQELALFAAQACPRLPLTALLVQDHQGISNAASPDSPLTPVSIPRIENDSIVEEEQQSSATAIHDHLCDLRFRISPTAFFQVNTLAAEKLYTLAGDWAGLDSETLLFDVCCGTGTIGLTLARRVGMVVGIEMNEAAVQDARMNAHINDIENCDFVCGKAEDVMHRLLKKYLLTENKATVDEVEKIAQDGHGSQESTSPNGNKFTSAVVIVDPPRSGLHHSVIKLLRTHEQIRRLVYVSCNPETLLANAVELCTPVTEGEETKPVNNGRNAWKRGVVGHARQRLKSMPISKPFSPVKAVAVDLFPHTPHCEMVMLMER